MTQDSGSPHEHQFVIPVEWLFSGNLSNTYEAASPTKKIVTKLRCTCGEETIR